MAHPALSLRERGPPAGNSPNRVRDGRPLTRSPKITAPRDLVPDWRLVGWRTDGGNVATFADSVRQVSPAGNRGISYLERTDRAAWPPGRYEFHVIAGQRTVALTVCITRRG